MRILAVADVHSPRFLDEFTASLDGQSAPDLLLMAGDMINRGAANEFPRILDVIENKIGCSFPIISCFGNDEYSEIRNDLVSRLRDRVTFLDEKSMTLEVDGKIVGIVGTQGSLDKPTDWQRRNIPNVKRVFERRAERAGALLRKILPIVDQTILLMHYSPCTDTCSGEDDRSFAWLGSRKFYTLISNLQPSLVIHGHVHNSTTHEASIGTTVVRNVSFPAVGSITQIQL
ncbi:MAG: metallophosphoesterase [Candidatus Thorarchaeota archaeon]